MSESGNLQTVGWGVWASTGLILLTSTFCTVLGLELFENLAPGLIQKLRRLAGGSSAGTGKNDPSSALALLENRKPGKLWNTVMFFPDYRASREDSTTQQFLWYFAQARTSLRICIYNFSFPELASVISQQYEYGLIVQFVVGVEGAAANVRKHGIPCGLMPRNPKIPVTDQLMHHKFVVIDDEAVLLGSMNWTVEGIITTKENVVVTTDPIHVKKYLQEFFKLQRICEDAKTYF